MVYRLICRRMLHSLAAMVVLVFAVLPAEAEQRRGTATPTPGAGWAARIVGTEASPSNLVAVDKKEQALFLFERHSPLRLAGKYTCTTGQNDGDKYTEGDLRTPEGVYFVVQRIGTGLNFEKYGYEAYTLNYPNPVDKLRKKTGYGIWIHGRGSPITPKLTEGCVSLNNTDLAVLGKNLVPGTPVALAAKVDFSPKPTPGDMALINTLYKRTHDWAKDWAGRSKKFFDYYAAEAYAAAQGESFKAFREQKERVFKNVSFIDIKVHNVQALQGPGYWVTWFQQDYRASNLTSKGVRRLYWQKDKKGDWRIVGMEWAPHLSGTLTAGLNGAPLAAESGKPLPAQAKDDGAGRTIAVASAQPVPARSAAAPLAEPAPMPVAVASSSPVESTPIAAVPTPPRTEEPVVLALAEMAGTSAPAKATPPAPAKVTPPAPAEAAEAAALDDVFVFLETWRSAWEKGDLPAYAACYDARAVQGSRSGVSAIRSHKAGLWKKSRPEQVQLTNIRIVPKGDSIVADMHQAYTDSSSFADMGVKTLHLQAKGGVWRIVREDWSPMQQ